MKAGGHFPIPSTFTVTDPQTRKQINISSDCKLTTSSQFFTKAGESVTRNANEYTFQHAESHTVINLIDTPGLMDTTDVGKSTHDTDRKHADNILKLLSAYQEIHAIFILMKANVTRLSDAFQYTLTEIFKRLDKSACNNVLFIFTNAASSSFKTDETQPILQRFLREKKLPIALPPEKPTIYCFENDTVKYLAECKNKIPHDEDDKEDAERSWKRSVRTTNELLDYLFSLKPHSLAVMMSMNDATNMVSMVSKVVLDTMMCIFKDVHELKDKKNEAEKLKTDIESKPRDIASGKLNSLLHIQETKLVHNALGYQNLVCESTKCTKVVSGHIVYPQICCKDCKCSGLIMYFCSSIGWFARCRICHCSKSQHKWRTTESKVVTKTVYRSESRVAGNCSETVDSNGALKQLNEGIARFEKRIKDCTDETKQMIEICAKLNAFVHQNASLGASSSDDELLRCLQNQREIYARSNSMSEADALEKIKSQYEQQLSKAKSDRYSVQEVPKLIRLLCTLPMKGKEIKNAVDEYKKSRREVIEKVKKSKKQIDIKGTSSVTSFFGTKLQ